MVTVNLNGSDPALQESIEKAVLASLSEEAKKSIIGQAVSYLVKKSEYGRSSPLAGAFCFAAETVARQKIDEYMKDPASGFGDQVRQLVDAVVKVMMDKVVVDKVCESITSLMSRVIAQLDS